MAINRVAGNTQKPSEFPAALRYLPEVARTVQEHTRVYDTQGQLQQNLDIATGLGGTLKSVEIGDLGVRVKADIAPSASQQLEDELLKSHHISRVQFENLAEAKRGTLDSKGEFKQSDNGLMIQFTAGESKEGKPQVHTMSVTEFNLYKKAFGQQPLSQSAQ